MSDGCGMWRAVAWLAVAAVAAVARCPAGCRCDADDVLRLTCGAQELQARDDGYFEVNCEGTELNCTALPQLTVGKNEPLQRLIIKQCSLARSAPLSCVVARSGARGVRNLALLQAPSELHEDHVRGLDLEKLFVTFTPGAQQSFPAAALGALPRLQSLRLSGGSAVELRARTLPAAPALRSLELSLSGVRRLPADAFLGLANLTWLSLWGNNIQDVSVDAFRGLDSLEQLVLNSNPLGSGLRAGVLAPAPRLRRLCLERNSLRELQEGVVSGLPLLQEIRIQSDVDLSVGARAFSQLPALTSLSLVFSKVGALPPDLFLNSTRLENLTLNNNRIGAIPEDLFRNLSALQNLDLSRNRIEVVTQRMFTNLAALAHINLDYNNIQQLPERVFGGLSRLTSVSVRHNALVALASGAFTGAGALRALLLAGNRLSWGAAAADYNSPMAPLADLQTLDLSHNNISAVFPDWRFVLRHLTALDLSHNAFTHLSFADVQFLGYINESVTTQVDFRNNNIRSISARAQYTAPAPNLRILLDNNPFECDCGLFDLIQDTTGRYVVADAACSQPAALRGRRLRGLSPGEVTCPVDAAPPCACVLRPALRRTECDCTHLAELPDPAAVGVDAMALRLRTARRAYHLPPFVRELSLAGLALKTAPAVPGSVRRLDLAGNLLAALPAALLRGNLTLRLARNPLHCDCWSAEQVALLQRSSPQIEDYENVTCAGARRLALVDAPALCAVYRSSVAGVLFAACLIVLAGAAAALYRYRLEAQVLLYSRGWCLRLLPREDPDLDKKYDVFVSFAHEDERFVCEELLPRLEARYSVHVQDRDWEVGGTIPAQLHRSVEQARRTLVVLSSSYVKSMWAAEGLRAAHTQAARDRRRRAVVLLTDVARKQLDEETRSFLSLAAHVKYGERMFWDKLAYALPRKDSLEYCACAGGECGGKARDVDAWKGGLNVMFNDQGKLINAGYVKDVV